MAEVLATGRFKTKKEAVEAGLLLIKRQEAMRELARMGDADTWGWDAGEGGPMVGEGAPGASVARSVVKPAAKSAVKSVVNAVSKASAKGAPRARRR